MSEDSNVTPEVDASTDDLDAFTETFFNKTPVEEVTEEVEEKPEEEVDPVEEADAEVEEEEAEEEEAEEEPEPKKPNRKTAKERISELTAEKRELREELAAIKAMLEAKNEVKEEKPKPVVNVDPGAPDPDARGEDGELLYPLGKFDPEYNADLVRYTMKVEREAMQKEAEASEAARQKAAEETQLVESWNTKLETTEEAIPDLREKIAVLEDNFSSLDEEKGMFLVQTIMSLERGPEVLYYLADNLSEAEALVASGPLAATLTLGRIEGRLPSAPTPEKSDKKVTSAPNPPKSVRGASSGSKVKPDTDNLEDFEKLFFQKKK